LDANHLLVARGGDTTPSQLDCYKFDFTTNPISHQCVGTMKDLHTASVREIAINPSSSSPYQVATCQGAQLTISDLNVGDMTQSRILNTRALDPCNISSLKWTMNSTLGLVIGATDERSGAVLLIDLRDSTYKPVWILHTRTPQLYTHCFNPVSVALQPPQHESRYIYPPFNAAVLAPRDPIRVPSLTGHQSQFGMLLGYENGVISLVDVRKPNSLISSVEDPYCRGIGDISWNSTSSAFVASGYVDFSVWRYDPTNRQASIWTHSDQSLNPNDADNNDEIYNAVFWGETTVSATSNGVYSMYQNIQP